MVRGQRRTDIKQAVLRIAKACTDAKNAVVRIFKATDKAEWEAQKPTIEDEKKRLREIKNGYYSLHQRRTSASSA